MYSGIGEITSDFIIMAAPVGANTKLYIMLTYDYLQITTHKKLLCDIGVDYKDT